MKRKDLLALIAISTCHPDAKPFALLRVNSVKRKDLLALIPISTCHPDAKPFALLRVNSVKRKDLLALIAISTCHPDAKPFALLRRNEMKRKDLLAYSHSNDKSSQSGLFSSINAIFLLLSHPLSCFSLQIADLISVLI